MRHYFILLLFLFIAFANQGSAQAQDSIKTLTIGLKEAPPFVQWQGDDPTGISVDFWNLVNQNDQFDYTYRRYDDVSALIKAVEKGAVDMSINPLTVSEQRMQKMDFSQPFYISGTAFVKQSSSQWLLFMQNFFTWRFLSAVAILLAVNFLIGILIWFAERRHNPDEFRGGLKGVADGFWWSAVTMTTVGYGDKSPRSAVGKVLGFIWMFAAILMISGLTAGIASSLTVSTLDDSIEVVEDLRRFNTGTVKGSSSDNYLSSNGVKAQGFASVKEGLQAVQENRIQVFVHDRPILKYHLQNHEKWDELSLSTQNLKIDYYSFAFPKGSKLRRNLDPLVVGALKSKVWEGRE